jgi:hypothetical protein
MNIKHNLSPFVFLAFAVMAALFACGNDEENPSPDPAKKGTLELKFDNIAGNTDFQLNQPYTNIKGERFKVDKLLYYVSNISFKAADGREYVVPQDDSYFLVNEAVAATQTIRIPNVPEGDYNEVTFMIGVDSLRSTMEPARRTGVLDVGAMDEKMYWTWNSGYIFLKMEGDSESAPEGPDGRNRFRFHIGGFGGYSSATINNIQKVTLSLGRDKAQVRVDRLPSIHIVADIMQVFNGPTQVSIAQNPTVMFSPFSVNIANNYARMFEYDHVHNTRAN